MERTWKDAIKKVLSESKMPLHYTEISERILAQGYFQTDGATPHSTVNALISASIKHDGEKSPFVRIDKGTFALKNLFDPPDTQTSSSKSKQGKNGVSPELEEQESNAIIHCFGMYWQRDLIVWRNDPKMYGKQNVNAKPVDFGKQIGIYILYDHHTVVYVGRSIDRPLGKRLFEHTVDRLVSRWNRFSWFGLLDVTDEGSLRETIPDTSLANLVATLEAILIETVEPPQNRKRGDGFTGMEYIQDVDPELKDREIKNTLRIIEQRMRG